MAYQSPIAGRLEWAWIKGSGMTVANDFDPAATGFAGSRGSIIATHDGLKIWMKDSDTDNNAWVALHPTAPPTH
jgi:hypothetical protein